LSDKLLTIDRTSANLKACSLKLARTAEPRNWNGIVKDEVAGLRPREELGRDDDVSWPGIADAKSHRPR
jgi:hypothetical protein